MSNIDPPATDADPTATGAGVPAAAVAADGAATCLGAGVAVAVAGAPRPLRRSKQARRSLSAAIAAHSASAGEAGCASAWVDASSKLAIVMGSGRRRGDGMIKCPDKLKV
ncbi:MAG TPA: hypothetical protein P5305_18895 [Rubrivivax sp.]|nr:hypothetical protein [Rubrivivax sp.]